MIWLFYATLKYTYKLYIYFKLLEIKHINCVCIYIKWLSIYESSRYVRIIKLFKVISDILHYKNLNL